MHCFAFHISFILGQVILGGNKEIPRIRYCLKKFFMQFTTDTVFYLPLIASKTPSPAPLIEMLQFVLM